MSSPTSSITFYFEDLRSSSRNEIKKYTPSKIMRNLIIVLKTDKNSSIIVEVFEFFSKKILEYFQLTDFNINEIEEFFIVLNDTTKKTFDHFGTSYFIEYCKIVINYIKNWKYFTEYVKNRKNDIHFDYLENFIYFSLCALENVYNFLKIGDNCEKLSNHHDIFLKCQELQREILSFFNDTSVMDFDFNIFTKCISSLNNTVEFATNLDIRTNVELWKFITKLFLENSKNIKFNKRCDLLKISVKHLSNVILSCISSIYTQEMPNYKDIEPMLKVNSFYLKVLLKLSQEFQHQDFHGIAEIHEIGLKLLTPPQHIQGNSKVYELINKYLTLNYFNIIEFTYKNMDFINIFTDLNSYKSENISFTFQTILQIFKILTEKNDCEHEIIELYLNSSKLNVLEEFLESVTDNGILLEQNNYVQLLMLTVILILRCETNKNYINFENFLTRGILDSKNILHANISFDMWFLFARASNVDIRYNYFIFWLQCTLKFPIFSYQLNAIYSKYLTKVLYQLLPTKYKEDFWKNCKDSYKDEILLILDTKNILDKNKKYSIIMNSINHIQRQFCLFNDYNSNDNSNCMSSGSNYFMTNYDDYYKMLINIEILKNIEICDANILKQLSGIIEYLIDLINLNEYFFLDKKFELSIKILLKFIYVYYIEIKNKILTENDCKQLKDIILNYNKNTEKKFTVIQIIIMQIHFVLMKNSNSYEMFNENNSDTCNLFELYKHKLQLYYGIKNENLSNNNHNLILSLNNLQIKIKNLYFSNNKLNKIYHICDISFEKHDEHDNPQINNNDICLINNNDDDNYISNSRKKFKYDNDEEKQKMLKNIYKDACNLRNNFLYVKPNYNDMKLINEIHDIFTQIQNEWQKK